MSPLEATIDPVWLIIVKVVILFVILLAWTIFTCGSSAVCWPRCRTASARS